MGVKGFIGHAQYRVSHLLTLGVQHLSQEAFPQVFQPLELLCLPLEISKVVHPLAQPVRHPWVWGQPELPQVCTCAPKPSVPILTQPRAMALGVGLDTYRWH